MSMTPESWISRHSLLPTPEAAKRLTGAAKDGVRMGVLLLARDNVATIGRHLLLLRHGWPGGAAPWSEILVADLGSSDATLEIAREHGATVIETTGLQTVSGIASGDGFVSGVERSKSDILLVVPASLVRLELDPVAALLAAMLDHPACRIAIGAESASGSALSRLSLRPLLAAVCPELSVVSDPASPLLAVRPAEVKPLPLARTEGYEAALAVDCWNLHGLESIVQVLVGELQWAGGDPRQNPTHAFHCQLAVLEALRRAGRIQVQGEFGHILPSPEEWTESGPRVVSRLEVFDWKEDETSLKLKAWFQEKL
ncbi:MAG: hypothetical protein RL173_1170 [Fibrobacterota bacterium]|jgi:glucosyl-3-phosphoglycerate synthase